MAACGLVLVLLLAANTRASAMFNATGVWEATHLFSDIKIMVHQDGGHIEGVVYVYGIFGGVDIYHYEGRIFEDGLVVASHHSGHTFEGRLYSDTEGEGVVTTAKRKLHIHFEATRVSDTVPEGDIPEGDEDR